MTKPTEEQLSEALRELVAAQPFAPDPAAIQRRGEHLRRQHRTIRIAGVAVVVAAVAVTTAISVRPNTTVQRAIPTHTPAAPPGPQLVNLAASVAAIPAQQGDASLVLRDQRYPTGEDIAVYDLYADNGRYYFAQQRSGLPAQVKADNNQGDGVFQREVADAIYAVTGDLSVARQRMADAPLSPGQASEPPATTADADGVVNLDNYVWENSMDAIVAGSSNPKVRAGVLRLLSTLPDITVKHGTTDGQPSVTIAAGGAESTAGQETWIINATTGIPIKFLGGDPDKPDVTITYGVTRVSLADVESGKF